MNKQNIITFLEIFYIIYMWNFFKTKYSVHNIWEVPLMKLKDVPDFFKHTINTNHYESKMKIYFHEYFFQAIYKHN